MESMEEWLDKRRAEFVLKQNPKKIISKSEYYALHKEGYFGNRPLTWRDYNDFSQSNYSGNVSIRSKKGIDRVNVRYNVPYNKVLENINEMHLKLNEVSINESMPDNKLAIQGEITQLDGRNGYFGIELRYSTLKKQMNIALKEEEIYLNGLNAKLKIKSAMDAPSYDNLVRLFEEFPDSAIEFSSYDIGVGNLGHNTVFWEVRSY
jgi:hypothetical protein